MGDSSCHCHLGCNDSPYAICCSFCVYRCASHSQLSHLQGITVYVCVCVHVCVCVCLLVCVCVRLCTCMCVPMVFGDEVNTLIQHNQSVWFTGTVREVDQ